MGNRLSEARPSGTTTYTYNARDQLTQSNQAGQLRTFSTTAPSGVAATPNVSFGYDAAGNRTSMSSSESTVTYAYDTASRQTSEARTFNGLAGSFTLSYAYNQLDQLSEITHPGNVKVGYSYNHAGEVTGVTGQGYAGVTSYASGMVYRAFGGLKQMNYGNGRTLSLQYNNRLMMTQWNISGVMGWNYSYHYFGENTGRVTYAQNIYDDTPDRSYDYDHVGRLIEARTASEARGHLIEQGGTQDGPYAHSYRYDQMGNMWYRVGWGGWFNPWLEQWPNYTNNRLTHNPWNGATMTYDAAGNLTLRIWRKPNGTTNLVQTFTWDGRGRLYKVTERDTNNTGRNFTITYDAFDRRIQTTEIVVTNNVVEEVIQAIIRALHNELRLRLTSDIEALHQLFNEATKLAGAAGTKGTFDAEVADQLLAKIDEIAEIFWETKKA